MPSAFHGDGNHALVLGAHVCLATGTNLTPITHEAMHYVHLFVINAVDALAAIVTHFAARVEPSPIAKSVAHCIALLTALERCCFS